MALAEYFLWTAVLNRGTCSINDTLLDLWIPHVYSYVCESDTISYLVYMRLGTVHKGFDFSQKTIEASHAVSLSVIESVSQ